MCWPVAKVVVVVVTLLGLEVPGERSMRVVAPTKRTRMTSTTASPGW
jgi:hypothetical protein